MNIARAFLIMSSIYILVGVILGIHMGATQDFAAAPVHAHINLLGFVSMAIFGFAYHLFPKMRESVLSTVHFWAHNTMVPIVLVTLFLVINGVIPGSSTDLLFMVTEIVIWIGYAIFAYLIFQHACRD